MNTQPYNRKGPPKIETFIMASVSPRRSLLNSIPGALIRKEGPYTTHIRAQG